MDRKKNSSEWFVSQLLFWYHINKRSLPWRVDFSNPYCVWISEIMLQQTQVNTVIPYYLRFIKAFPTVKNLAHAPLEKMLCLWQGLGYYMRARNLHKSAELIDQNGFPQNEIGWRELPGIGPYTAAVICAIAYDQQCIAVDGNIERILSRYGGIKDREWKKEIKKLAELLLSHDHIGDYTQALMDLGALICRPKQPLCEKCPLNNACMAFIHKDILSFSPLKPKRALNKKYGNVFWITRADGKVLVHYNTQDSLLKNLYHFPISSFESTFVPMTFLDEWKHIGEISHIFTHFSLQLKIWIGKWEPYCSLEEGYWIAPEKLQQYAFSRLMRKVEEYVDSYYRKTGF